MAYARLMAGIQIKVESQWLGYSSLEYHNHVLATHTLYTCIVCTVMRVAENLRVRVYGRLIVNRLLSIHCEMRFC